MAKGSNTFGGTIKLQGEKEYRDAIKSINSDLKVMASEMKKVTAQYSSNNDSVESLTERNRILNDQIVKQEEKVGSFSKAVEVLLKNHKEQEKQVQKVASSYEEAVSSLERMKSSSSSTSSEIEKQEERVNNLKIQLDRANSSYADGERKINIWKADLNKAEAELYKLNNELEKNEKDLEDSKKATEKGYKSLEEFRKAADDAGESTLSFGDVLKANIISDVVLGGIKTLASSFISMGRSILDTVENTKEYRQELSVLTQNADDAGLKIDNVKDKLANLTAITGESDSSVEALSNLMATGFDEKGMVQAVEALSGAIVKFPDTLKIESLADGLQETLATGEATGAFAELIERMGGSLENFNEKLAGCSTEAEKQQVALEWLADSGLAKVNEAYQNTNKEMIAAEEAQFRLNDAIAAFATNIEPFVAIIKEGLADVLTNLIGVINGDEEAIGNLSTSIGTLAGNIIVMIEESIPVIMEVLATLIPTMVNSIIQYLPQFVETGRNMLMNLIQGITNNLPSLITTAVDMVLQMATTFISNLGTIVDVGIDLIFALVDGIIQSLPTLIEKAPKIINDFWDAFDKNLWKIIKAGGQLIVKLGKGIIDSIPVIIKNAGEIIWAIVNTILHVDMINVGKNLIKNLGSGLKSMGGSITQGAKDLVNKLLHPFKNTTSFREIGKNIISGIINGIKSMGSSLISAGKNAVSSAVTGIKNFLGIHSPSTVFRDQVGKFMALGLSEGFTDEMAKVNKDIQKAIPTDFDMSVNASISKCASNDINSSFGGLGFNMMVSAFKEALKGVNVVLDDEKVGTFVENVMEGVLV